MSYFSYTESERPRTSAGPSICTGIFADQWTFNSSLLLYAFCKKAQEKHKMILNRKNSFWPSHCTSRLAALDQSVTFSIHSDVRRRLGCIFLRVTVLHWKPSREVKNSIPRTLYSANHLHSLSLVVTRLQPFHPSYAVVARAARKTSAPQVGNDQQNNGAADGCN